jgi:hypothetical protein
VILARGEVSLIPRAAMRPCAAMCSRFSSTPWASWRRTAGPTNT